MSIDSRHPTSGRLFFPQMESFYRNIAQPAVWVILRVVVGGLLVVEGWPKILAPLAQVGFVEGLGFYPSWFWSPLLAVMQFFGGIAIVIGLFTRPAALANALMLPVTFWYHFNHPYGDAFLTQLGLETLKAGGDALFTADGMSRLADGGTAFLAQVQNMAEFLSAVWTVAVLFFAGHGGGPLSVDEKLRRQF